MSKVFWYSIAFAASLSALSAQAAVFCASTPAELQSALGVAASNGETDEVRIAGGRYEGNFVYASRESEALNIKGGYSEGCTEVTSPPAVSELIGTSDSDPVLVLTVQTAEQSQGLFVSRLGIIGGKNRGALINSTVPVTIEECEFKSNYSWTGGALAVETVPEILILRNRFVSNTAGYHAGALLVGDSNALLHIEDNLFFANSANIGNVGNSYGGAINAVGREVQIKKNWFQSNMGTRGGGIFVGGTDSVQIIGNHFIDNHGTADLGGGMMLFGWGKAELRVENNVFVSNSAGQEGGGAFVIVPDSGHLTLIGNLVARNQTFRDEDQFGFGGGGISLVLNNDLSADVVANNVFWENESPSGGADLMVDNDPNNDYLTAPVQFLSNALDLTSDGLKVRRTIELSSSNLQLRDPLFHRPGDLDFRLGPNSPLIDSGYSLVVQDDGRDLAGYPRAMGSSVDIGPYESAPYSWLYAIGAYGIPGISVAVSDPANGRFFSRLVDSVTGELTAEIPLTPEVLHQQAGVGDLNNNGTDDLAVLTVDAEGFVEIKIKDGLTGELISKMPFEADFHPLWLRVVPDTGGDESVDLAVLGIRADGKPRAQVRDALSGALVSKVYFETAYVPFGFEVIQDLDGSTFPELAVLGVDAEGRVRAQVKDVISGQRVSMVYFDKRYTPSHTTGMDMDGDGLADALAVLGENAEGIVRAQVKDVATATPLGLVRFESGYTSHTLVSVPDANLSGSPELAVLQTDAEGRVRVQVKDAVTGQAVSVIGFAGEHEPRDLVVVPDVNSNQHSELAYLGEGPVGTYLLQIKDVVTGQALTNTTFE